MTPVVSPVALRARWVLPLTGPPLRDGVVTMAGDRIVAVGENVSGCAPRDLGDVALLPGFVNPHTHLEFHALTQPLGSRGMPFPAWIVAVVTRRRAAAAASGDRDAAEIGAVLRQGLAQNLAEGVTTVGDILAVDVPSTCASLMAGCWVALRELRGLADETCAVQCAVARRHLQHTVALRGVRGGLSPHAPYTVARHLLSRICQMSADTQCPVAMHLAESREELELLATGEGAMRDMLEQLGAWYPRAFAQRGRPRDYLEVLATAHRSLVIHGNYLTSDEWRFLAQHAARMTVVYCPRTHEYFEHPPYPLAAMLRAGVRVVVGTDSRASNPDGNLWRELQFAARAHPGVAPDRILRMGTAEAAAALGCDDEVGTLAAGKRADIVAVTVSPSSVWDPAGLLLAPESQVQHVLCGGRFVEP